MEISMSERTEKLIHIIAPDLLNYLEMVERREFIERRLKENIPLAQRKEKDVIIEEEDKISNK